MSHRKIATMSLSGILVLAFVADVMAQGGKQPEDPHANDRKIQQAIIDDVTPKIVKNCASLKDTIISANATPAEFAYDDNQADPNFDSYCQSGRLDWIAKRVFSPTDLEKRNYTVTVTASAADQLGNSRALPDGVVLLISETASIRVDDGTGHASQQVKWNLDLKEEEYAQKFVLGLKDLSANLKKKTDAQASLAALPAPPAPPAPPAQKRRRRNRR
jgi:hypothetical protein